MSTQVARRDQVADFKSQVMNRESEFRMALPAHIPVERFMRVINTAVTGNPDLLGADRVSLFQSAMKAAQDGLLPDGRDGALVIFKNKVQWMPMIGGILKKVRNSGELLSISAYVAYSNDEFEYSLGDEEKITHRPALDDRGRPRLVYAIAKTKDGGIYREVMTVTEVERVRSVSRAGGSGPWKDWWDEMARKTVLRRLSKRLPMSSDLDDLVRRDDELYEFDAAKASTKADGTAPRGLSARLDALAGPADTITHDQETGEVTQEHSETGAEDDTASQAAGVVDGGLDSSATSAVEPAADEPDNRSEDEKLLDAARAKSLEGRRAFDAWFNRLRPEQIDALNPHMKGLMAAAKQADGRA
ncbi:recombination protein RecT [Methylosinus sp. sav-2]|uniref:recombinase RecT n=1 Tax=Methylosinus sp. sav-2 TaxID=2485168 RepID=UPI00068D578A|nr:recombinase RecT [Methylosinus sp. sav-2]TDX61966.1 recombination protein RecT [Methylosinus sp. sav-2]